jgi:hypothetical protein
MHEDDARRIMRHAMTNRIFLEPEKGRIGHSAASQAIATVPYFKEWINETCDRIWPVGPRIVDAMQNWPGSQEPNQTGFNLAFNTDVSFFGEISKNPANARRFANSMTFFQASPGMAISHIVDNYDWAAHSSGTLVDIGGSHGPIAIELSKRFPSMKCVVQDLPQVIAGAVKPDDCGQVEFQVYDFFTEQPVKEADVYMYRMILHNWSDNYCFKILNNLIPALKKKARIIINDHVVPEPGTIPPYFDRSIRTYDITMKALFNAGERDENDWRDLLRRIDERFRVNQIIRPEGSQLQIIEVIWNGD